MNRYPDLVHFIKGKPEGTNRPFEQGCVSNVELKTCFLEQTAGLASLALPLFSEVNIVSTGKTVFLVPLAFAVSEKY